MSSGSTGGTALSYWRVGGCRTAAWAVWAPSSFILQLHSFFPFFTLLVCSLGALTSGHVCPYTCVHVVLAAVRAAVGDASNDNSRGTGCEQKHVLPCAHCVPIRHPLSTPRSLGETSLYFWNFCGLPGAQKLKKGTKGNSILIRLVFNLLNGQSLLIVYLSFVLNNIYSLCSLQGSDGFAYTLIFLWTANFIDNEDRLKDPKLLCCFVKASK